MDLHVCIKVDDDAVNKIARIITETVKKVTEIQQAGEVQQPSAAVQPAPDPSRAANHSLQCADCTGDTAASTDNERAATCYAAVSAIPTAGIATAGSPAGTASHPKRITYIYIR